MGDGKRLNKFLKRILLFILLFYFFGKDSFAQYRYYRSYSDFIKNNYILPSEIKSSPYWRVFFENGLPIEVSKMDATGREIEKRVNIYSKERILLETRISLKGRLTRVIDYRGDSTIADILKKLKRDSQLYWATPLLIETDWDSTGKIIRKVIKDYSGYWIGTIDYKYNDSGEVISQDTILNEVLKKFEMH